jgi:hypothetical protein
MLTLVVIDNETVMRTLLCVLLVGLMAGVVSGQGNVVQLFDGKSLDGWKQVGYDEFVIEDGMMKTTGGMGLLFYEREKFGDCTLRVVFKTGGGRANSGVVIRLPEPPSDAWYGVHNGYEVQIDEGGDEWHRTGAIYSISPSTGTPQKPAGEWNTMEIELRGNRTRVRLNGELINDYTEGGEVPPRKIWYEPVRGPRPNVGYIGLQNHDPASVVYFKEVSIVR